MNKTLHISDSLSESYACLLLSLQGEPGAEGGQGPQGPDVSCMKLARLCILTLPVIETHLPSLVREVRVSEVVVVQLVPRGTLGRLVLLDNQVHQELS